LQVTSIYEITSWSDVGSFLVWTLAVCAIARALFGSLPAAELQYRLSLRGAPRRQRMSRLNWEVNSRKRWDEDVARGSPHAAAVSLSDDEVEARRRELQQLTRTSFAWRAFTYFMGCFACQTFWSAVAIYAFTRGVADPAGCLFSAAAYSGAAVLLSVVRDSSPSARGNEHPSGRAGCKDCGR
jgi:hypothetical protein